MTYYLFSLKKANSSVLSIRGKFIVEITTRRTLGTPGQKYIIDKDVSQQACLQATATTLGLTPLLSRVISDSFLRRNLITSQRSTGHFKTWPLANGPSRTGTFNLVSSEPAISVPNGPSGLSAPLCGVFLYYTWWMRSVWYDQRAHARNTRQRAHRVLAGHRSEGGYKPHKNVYSEKLLSALWSGGTWVVRQNYRADGCDGQSCAEWTLSSSPWTALSLVFTGSSQIYGCL